MAEAKAGGAGAAREEGVCSCKRTVVEGGEAWRLDGEREEGEEGAEAELAARGGCCCICCICAPIFLCLLCGDPPPFPVVFWSAVVFSLAARLEMLLRRGRCSLAPLGEREGDGLT
jgi:hypothetical protein